MWIYQRTETNLYTVMTVDANGKQICSDSDWSSREKAAQQVSYLNGGNCGPANENSL